MASPGRSEEGYPLGPFHTGADNDAATLPSPVTTAHGRRHHARGGIPGRLRAKFYSFRPRVRLLIVAVCSIVPIYWLADVYYPDRRWTGPGGDHQGDSPQWGDKGKGPSNIPRPPPSGDPTNWAGRTDEVKAAFVHAYSGYEMYAFPADELLPLTKGRIDNFNGWGVSAVDSLDTMLMMGLLAEYKRGTQLVAKTDYKAHNTHVPFFETSIRYFGGLLSAYSSTKDPLLLQKAEEIGAALFPALDTPAGYPKFSVRPSDGDARAYWGKDLVILAEMGSIQMEYKYLAHLTGRKDYFTKVERIMAQMEKHIDPEHNLLPIFFNFDTGNPSTRHFSIGALADSAYEYVLKQYIMTGKTERRALDMYLKLTQGIMENLLYISPDRELLYATDVDGPGDGWPTHVFEHLSCFLPGVFALGAHSLPLSKADKRTHLWIAEGLAQTCYISYADQASGLGPEEMAFTSSGSKWYPHFQKWEKEGGMSRDDLPPGVHKDKDLTPVTDPGKRDYTIRKDSYLLRPGTVESIFILWRVTGDVVWRHRGYEIFRAIEKMTRTDVGYASIHNVDSLEPIKQNSMPSYFLAETLKYLWLLFRDNDDRYDLDKVVFNTEAHPFPVFKWSAEEIKHFEIPT